MQGKIRVVPKKKINFLSVEDFVRMKHLSMKGLLLQHNQMLRKCIHIFLKIN